MKQKDYQDELEHMHQFKTNMVERKRIDVFKEQTKKHYGEYGTYEYIFTPTGIGMAVEIKSEKSGIKIDVTDYDSW